MEEVKVAKGIFMVPNDIIKVEANDKHKEITIAKVTYRIDYDIISELFNNNIGFYAFESFLRGELCEAEGISFDEDFEFISVSAKTVRKDSDDNDWELAKDVAIAKCNRKILKIFNNAVKKSIKYIMQGLDKADWYGEYLDGVIHREVAFIGQR